MERPTEGFNSFQEFYPYYLSEHSNSLCRWLHFVGTTGVVILLIMTVYSGNPAWLLLTPVVGYGFAWVGHFFFEHNKPATFQYPFYSFIGDWVMLWQILRGQVSLAR